MKVLVINSLYYPNGIGGAERNVQVTAEEMAKNNMDVVVITTSDRDYTEYVNGVKVYYIKTRNLYWGLRSKEQPTYRKPLWHMLDSYNFLMAGKVGEIIRSEKPDVAQTNSLSGFSVAVWPILKKNGIPILHILHDHYLLCLKTNMFAKGENCHEQCPSCKYLSVPKRHFSGLVDSLAGVSRYIINRHLENGFFKNARDKLILPNIFEFSFPEPKTVPDQIRFGFIGLLTPGKGIEFLLEHFQKIQGPEPVLYIYGKSQTGGYEEHLKKVYQSDRIRFMGYNTNLKEVYQSFDVLIIPSLWNETAGRVVIEANSHGIPVIASNRGGISEFVEQGRTGFVFDPDTPESLVEKIRWAYENSGSVRQMSEDCVKNARNFSKEAVIDKYIKAHSALLDGRK